MANLNVIDFEKSLAELDANLATLREIVQDRHNPQNTATLPSEIAELEQHRTAFLNALFTNLTPWDKVLLARHERRPYTLDYVQAFIEDFEELHGDRLFGDDGAIVSGIGRFEGRPVAVVGHQKGRDIKQRQLRNFGYARPEGYRKAVRIMKLAAKFHMPVITFVDTPGAAADVAADERGISAAIAQSMFEMAGLETQIVSVVIGEGGSGGALGIALADRVLMLEHAIYSVIAPEGCAAILWRDPEQKADAAKALNLTAQRARDLGVIDDIVREPLGGAHRDPEMAAQNLREAIARHLSEISKLSLPDLLSLRYRKFRCMGAWSEESDAAQEQGGEAE